MSRESLGLHDPRRDPKVARLRHRRMRPELEALSVDKSGKVEASGTILHLRLRQFSIRPPRCRLLLRIDLRWRELLESTTLPARPLTLQLQLHRTQRQHCPAGSGSRSPPDRNPQDSSHHQINSYPQISSYHQISSYPLLSSIPLLCKPRCPHQIPRGSLGMLAFQVALSIWRLSMASRMMPLGELCLSSW